MLEGERTLSHFENTSWRNQFAKKILLNVFSQLPYGQLTICENGSHVGTYGDSSSSLHAEINILSAEVYPRLLFGGSIAAGETYAARQWVTSNLTNVVRIFARNLDMLDKWEQKLEWLAGPVRKFNHWRQQNSKAQAKDNISAHYDLGNNLYRHFLDDSMMYSAAIFPHKDASLAHAQQHKLKAICEKLQLSQHDHLLEIGTGWGGLAVYAARHYGCRVTTTTISDEQFEYARQWIANEQLQHKITLLKHDYRELEGTFDKLVSIEMIEAVGKRYLPTFFEQCSGLLKDDGVMVLQSITMDDRRYETYSKSVDFIQKYIFPGGFLPSLLDINAHLKQFTDLSIRDTHDIGIDYAYTLKHWQQRFNENRHALTHAGYDEHFMGLWNYYFSYCEGGFLERTISTVQLVLSKPRCDLIWAR